MTAIGEQRTGHVFTHRAVLADSVDGAAAETAVLLSASHDRGRDPIVAVLRPEVEQRVRARLVPDVEAAVTFLAPAAGLSPGAVARHHLDDDAGRRLQPSVVTDLVPDFDPYGSDCLQSEVLAHRDLVDRDEEHTCIYPRVAPFARIANVSHPLLREHGTDRPNADFRGMALVRDEPALAHLDPHATVRDVLPHVDPDLWAWLAEAGRIAHADEEVVDQIVLATHEALRTGAESRTPVEHGRADPLATAEIGTEGVPGTRLYLHHPVAETPAQNGDAGRLLIDIDAAWLPALDTEHLPDDRTVAGLWIARAACRQLAITIHPLTPTSSRIRITAPAPDR